MSRPIPRSSIEFMAAVLVLALRPFVKAAGGFMPTGGAAEQSTCEKYLLAGPRRNWGARNKVQAESEARATASSPTWPIHPEYASSSLFKPHLVPLPPCHRASTVIVSLSVM